MMLGGLDEPLEQYNGMPKLQKILIVVGMLIAASLLTSVIIMAHVPRDLHGVTMNRVTKIGTMSCACWSRNAYWPTNLQQMVSLGMLRPQDTNDAWGRSIVYVPYNPTLMRGTVASLGLDGRADIQMIFH